MTWDILLTIAATATIQSLFGVGVLLFGTPVLLVLDYPFLTALSILLPVSLTINLLQVGKHYRLIDRSFYRTMVLFAIPFVIGCLVVVAKAKVNIGAVVGVLLVLVALKSVWPKVEAMLAAAVRYERTSFVAMGIVHGLTNLGGSLLTALVHGKNYDKDVARVTTAVCYGTFALFQLATLAWTQGRLPIPATQSAICVAIGAGMFLLMDRLLYTKISPQQYRAIFAVFLFGSGLVLIAKQLLLR